MSFNADGDVVSGFFGVNWSKHQAARLTDDTFSRAFPISFAAASHASGLANSIELVLCSVHFGSFCPGGATKSIINSTYFIYSSGIGTATTTAVGCEGFAECFLAEWHPGG